MLLRDKPVQTENAAGTEHAAADDRDEENAATRT